MSVRLPWFLRSSERSLPSFIVPAPWVVRRSGRHRRRAWPTFVPSRDLPVPEEKGAMDATARTDTVRMGVLGTGNIADLNVAGYLEHPKCEVLAVCDVDGDVARDAAQRWNVPRVYTDIDAFLAD